MERERERESKDARAPLWSPRCCRCCFFFFVVALVINLRSRRAVKSNTCGTESVKKSFSTPSLSLALFFYFSSVAEERQKVKRGTRVSSSSLSSSASKIGIVFEKMWPRKEEIEAKTSDKLTPKRRWNFVRKKLYFCVRLWLSERSQSTYLGKYDFGETSETSSGCSSSKYWLKNSILIAKVAISVTRLVYFGMV